MAELEEAASKVIRSGCYLHGQETEKFEEELAALSGAAYAIGVSNGLDALRLILRSYIELGRLHKGDAVMVASNTFIATVLPITEFGLVPVFVEPDYDTMNFSWRKALDILQENDRAGSPRNIRCAMVTHLYGTPCWNLMAASEMRKRGVIIVEDNAQAIGAEAAEVGFNGVRSTGNLADAAAISFYPTKNIGALGDAGAVLTNDFELAVTVRALANYGTDRRYHNLYAGFNCRLDEIQAAMLRIKLHHIEEEIRHRNMIASIYSEEITNPLVTVPRFFSGSVQVWHQYEICVDPDIRDRMREYLAESGVPTDMHYPVPPYLQPCYIKDYDPKEETTAILLSKSCISLPIANITPEQASEVARIINEFNP
ncbi:MAG: DegT/DnrJ/EryC1/StrS family aminotransferase [Muribaculaceae bacterium]|nr:DegT/DnrJ/EryC1/StrS family aminotransferase [Muribaculaceae bacterium]